MEAGTKAFSFIINVCQQPSLSHRFAADNENDYDMWIAIFSAYFRRIKSFKMEATASVVDASIATDSVVEGVSSPSKKGSFVFWDSVADEPAAVVASCDVSSLSTEVTARETPPPLTTTTPLKTDKFSRRASLPSFLKDGLLYQKRGKSWSARYATLNEETGDLKLYVEKSGYDTYYWLFCKILYTLSFF